MWITINIILIVAGAYGIYHAYEINKPENTDALVSAVLGFISIAIGMISSGVKYFN